MHSEKKSALTSAAPERLLLLEGLRGYMAWWVVLGHFLLESGFVPAAFPSFAKVLISPTYAVDVFIILSGFVIAHLLENKPSSYRQFVGRRFFRLYPLFLVCILVGLVAFEPIYQVSMQFAQTLQTNTFNAEIWDSRQEHMGAHFVASVTMFHGAIPNAWLPGAQSVFVPPGWSISLEWQFYLVIPLVMALFRSRPLVTLGLIAAVVCFRRYYDVGGWGSFLPMHAEFFALGVLSYYLYLFIVQVQRSGNLHIPWLLLTLFLLLMLLEPMRNLVMRPRFVELGGWLPISIWLLTLALLVETHAPAPGRIAVFISRLFINPALLFLGRISYSTYLLHYFSIHLVMAGLLAWGIPLSNGTALAGMFILAGPLTLALSALSFQYIELPGMALGKRFFRGDATVKSGRSVAPKPFPSIAP